MKNKSHIAVAVLLLCVLAAQSQNCHSDRYRERIFSNVSIGADIVFGNAPAVTSPYVGENVTVDKDLTLDLFEPAGDTLGKRPLVILAFGGGFLIGSKEDEDIRATCDSLARLGYVAASINYRLGMDLLQASSAERAVFRGVQDYSAAVRYFKEFAGQYRIDTNYIFIGGVSAGAISALQLAFGEEADRPLSTYASGPPNSAPDLGCTDCSGNGYYHRSSNVKAVINCWGAMGDVNWIEPGEEAPIISFHGDMDPVVPYDSGYPFTALATMPVMYGSLPISQRADSIGLYNEFYPFPGEGHNVWGTVVNNAFVGGPTAYFRPIVHAISAFSFRFLKPEANAITGDTSVSVNDTVTYSVPFNNGSVYCWDVTGGAFVSPNITANSVDVRWNAEGLFGLSVMEISHLRAQGETQTLAVSVNPLTVGAIREAGDVIGVYPNPATGSCTISCRNAGNSISGINLTDMSGKMILRRKYEYGFRNALKLNVGELPHGTYLLKVASGSGETYRQIVVL